MTSFLALVAILFLIGENPSPLIRLVCGSLIFLIALVAYRRGENA